MPLYPPPPHTRPRLHVAVTVPASEPLTLAETKLYLRIDHNTEDAHITRLIRSAREAAELFLRRSLLSRQWKLVYDDGLACPVLLPMGPVEEVISVTAVARDGTPQEVAETAYTLNAARTMLEPLQAISAYRVEIIYSAGYGDTPELIPASILQGMLAHVAGLYEGQPHAYPLPESCIALYAPYRERYV